MAMRSRNLGGWKRKGCRFRLSNPISHPKRKNSAIYSRKKRGLTLGICCTQEPSSNSHKGCCTNGDVRLERLLHQYLRAIGSVLRPPKKGARLWADSVPNTLLLLQVLQVLLRPRATSAYLCVSGVPIPCRGGPATRQRFVHRPSRSWQAYRKEVNGRKETGKRLKCVA